MFNISRYRCSLKTFLSVVTLGLAVSLASCSITEVTSSTSGTVDAVTPDVTLNEFVNVRFASIQKEAARGQGENLDALAELMGRVDKPEFSEWMRSNYNELFTNLGQPSELISRIESVKKRSI